MVVDSAGNIYIVGYTASTAGFPTTAGAFSTTCQNCNTSVGSDDAFVIKLNSAFVQLYGTFLSGNDDDEGYSIAADDSGNAYVTGFTNSSNFPVTNGSTLKSLVGNAFVTEINPQGNGLVFSTFLGGSAREFGQAIALDSAASPNIYLHGYSYSTDSPVVGTPITTPPAVMYHSTNGGTGWSAGTGVKSLDVKAIVVDKSNPGTVYAGAIGGLYKSADSGATWTATPISVGLSFNPANVPGDYVQGLAIVPNITPGLPATLYAGSRFFGVQQSTDGGATWAAINSGLTNQNVLSLAVNANGTLVFGGTSGSGVLRYSTVSGTSTALTTTGLANKTINALVYDANADTLYAGTNNGVYQLLTASGSPISWNTFTQNLTSGTVTALAEDSNATPNLYAATFGGGLFRTSTGVDNWSKVNGSGGTALGTLLLRALAVDPSNANNIYVGGRNGVFKSADGAATWAAINAGLTANSAYAITVDPANGANVYAGMGNHMAFVTKLTPGGASTSFASQFGGTSGVTEPLALAVDGSGNMYIAGETVAPSNMPSPLVGPQSTLAGPNLDGFVSKINSSGAVVWDRYLGSPESDDFITGVGVDNSSNVYVTGFTAGTFPVTANAYQSTLNGPIGVASDVFLTKLDTSGANLLYSTYFGGTGDDWAYSLAMFGNTGQVGIAGESTSRDIAGGNGIQPLNLDGDTALYAQFDTTKSGAASLVNWTFLGGSTGFEFANSVAVDSSKSVYLTGATWSTDFPITGNAIHTTLSSAPDAFFAKLASNGNTSDVALTMTTSSPTVFSGQAYSYTLTVTNNGSSPAPLASSVQVFDLLPANVTLTSTPCTTQGTCTGSLVAGAKVVCSIGSLASGA